MSAASRAALERDMRDERMKECAGEMFEAAKEFLELHPVFRSKPLGAPGSYARQEQDARIAAEDTLRKLFAKVEGP